MKIAFITDGFQHAVKDNAYEMLKKNFPNAQIDWIKILDIAKKKRIISIVNLFFIIKEYWRSYLNSSSPFLFYFFRTTYIFKKMREELTKIIRKEKYDFTFQMMLMFDASVEGIPHFTYSDVTHLTYKKFPSYNKWRQNSNEWVKLEKEIYQNANLNFLWSRNIARDMIELYGISEEKIKVVGVGGNSISENSHNLTDLKRYESKIILFVGYDWERKGGPLLYEAFKKVLKYHKDAKLIIVGSNPVIDNLNGAVKIFGRQNKESTAQFFEKASIYCMPTLREPFGLVFVEAMFYYLPIVAWNMGALPELVENGKNGFLIDPLNVDELSNKIIELLSSPNICLQMGKEGRKKAEVFYDWNLVGQKIKIEIEKNMQEQKAKIFIDKNYKS